MEPQNAREFIKALGGVWSLSKEMGLGYLTVKGWSSRNIIPAYYWAELIEIAEEKGVHMTAQILTDWASLKRGRWRRPKGGWYAVQRNTTPEDGTGNQGE